MARNATFTKSDADAHKRREIRDSKPTREWTAEERCEAFREMRLDQKRRAEAGVLADQLCEICHEYADERGLCWCTRRIGERRKLEG
jgi:hypothetical protein